MPSLQVRELPEPIYRKLAAEADKEHRSLSQQAIAVLARGLDDLRKSPIKTIGKKALNPVDMIREDRNR
jgi:plasmid stability protein